MFKQSSVFLFLLFSFSAYAQKQYNVFDWKADVSLNTYLVQQMHQQYQLRAKNFEQALTEKAQTLAYINSVKEKAKEALGNFPEKSPLNAQITGSVKQEGYRIEKVVYQSFEHHHVTANLYIPEGKGKFPSVLLFCGHEDLAKATESYQKTAILLAKNGFVVFVIDPISQSERIQLTDVTGKSLTRGSTTEHTLLNLSSNLLGTSIAAYELFDNQCGLDYLLTRKEVDANSIGCIGNSGGAMQAIYFAALDDRVKVIVPCSYLANREHTLSTTGAADGCAQIPNEGSALLEMSDYLISAAPKPILVLAGRYDFIDYNSTLRSFEDLKKVYASLGDTSRISLFTFDDGHGISKPKRERAVQWFRKWFYLDDRPIVEPELHTLSDQELFASPKQKVSLSFRELTIDKRNLQLFEKKAESRAKFAQLSSKERQQVLLKMLNIEVSEHGITTEEVGIVQNKEITFHKIIVRKANEMPLPLLVYYPLKPIKKVVIWLSDIGKNKLADSIQLIKQYVEQQEVALVLTDIRGIGETADKTELNDPKYFSKDYRNAMLALHIGRPLLGQRTSDILTLLDFIKLDPQLKDRSIEINAIGLVGLPALNAVCLSPSIVQLNLYQSIYSYRQVIDQPLAKDRYGIVAYHLLEQLDIPDLVNWIGSEKIHFYP
jgi:dienelactone hydrolase